MAFKCSISTRSTSGNHGLSRQDSLTTFAPGCGLSTKRLYVSSVSRSGLKLTQISLLGLRMDGISVSHESFETLCASSTQTTSMPSTDLMFVTLCLRPANTNSVPFGPRMVACCTWYTPRSPRRSMVSLSSRCTESFMLCMVSRAQRTRSGR